MLISEGISEGMPVGWFLQHAIFLAAFSYARQWIRFHDEVLW
jgi:hypothetical protein